MPRDTPGKIWHIHVFFSIPVKLHRFRETDFRGFLDSKEGVTDGDKTLFIFLCFI